MTTKKQYIIGYNYWLYQSLIYPTTLVLENELPSSKGRLEAKIVYTNGSFRLLITDGYIYLYDKSGFRSLKQTMNIAHGMMQDMTHNSYKLLD